MRLTDTNIVKFGKPYVYDNRIIYDGIETEMMIYKFSCLFFYVLASGNKMYPCNKFIDIYANDYASSELHEIMDTIIMHMSYVPSIELMHKKELEDAVQKLNAYINKHIKFDDGQKCMTCIMKDAKFSVRVNAPHIKAI